MADRFKKTQAGQPLDVSAEVWNSFLDTVREQKGKKHDQLAEALDQIRQGDIVKVRNNSGDDRLRFHVLGIDSPIISPSEHLREFKNQVALEGVKPKHPASFHAVCDSAGPAPRRQNRSGVGVRRLPRLYRSRGPLPRIR